MTDLMPTLSSESSFASLGLREALFTNLASLGYEQMTAIQAASLPLMLQKNDLIAQAKTGSGKTAAFGLALLNHLQIDYYAVQALVLCPTRELAEQTSQALRRLARSLPNVKILNLSGGLALRPQVDSLKHSAHIIVGTPGRVQKHLDKETLTIAKLQTLVLDEADRMLDMGFLDAITQILSFCPKNRQTLLFSATFPKEIEELAQEFMYDAKRIEIKEAAEDVDIEQHFYELSTPKEKFALLKTLLNHHQPSSTLIFCNTKEQTTHLAKELKKEGFAALALNGDMEQAERDLAVIRFSNKSATILVATDVAARGLDIKELPIVFNFDLAFEPEVHIHRIGRTGRAKSKGLAISLTIPADAQRLIIIEKALTHALDWKNTQTLNSSLTTPLAAPMVTLCLAAGKKDKIRPGDIVGALIKDAGLREEMIGQITITALYSYIAIQQTVAHKAYQYLQTGKLKGRTIKVSKLA